MPNPSSIADAFASMPHIPRLPDPKTCDASSKICSLDASQNLEHSLQPAETEPVNTQGKKPRAIAARCVMRHLEEPG